MNIPSNPALLRRMVSDMRAADPLYRPTSFWEHHEASTVEWLLTHDLDTFRDGRTGLGGAFGATHFATPPWPLGEMAKMEAQAAGVAPRALAKVLSVLPGGPQSVFNPAVTAIALRRLRKATESLQSLSYYSASLIDVDGTLPRISDSGLGHPSDGFTVEGRFYTYGFLKRFSQYAYVKQFVDFSRVNAVLEIGSGYGGQPELLAKAHPHLRFCLVDIPPQLYVAQQYLTACFPGQVAGYDATTAPGADLATLARESRFLCLAPWQLPQLQGVSFDLFWNSASFQEMEPHVVQNYASHVNRLVDGWVYLMNKPAGTRVQAGSGRHGVEQQTRLEHYTEYFSAFDLVEQREARLIPRVQAGDVYHHMIFRGRAAAGRTATA